MLVHVSLRLENCLLIESFVGRNLYPLEAIVCLLVYPFHDHTVEFKRA